MIAELPKLQSSWTACSDDNTDESFIAFLKQLLELLEKYPTQQDAISQALPENVIVSIVDFLHQDEELCSAALVKLCSNKLTRKQLSFESNLEKLFSQLSKAKFLNDDLARIMHSFFSCLEAGVIFCYKS